MLLLSEDYDIREQGIVTFGTTLEHIFDITINIIFRPTLPSSSGSSKRYYFEHLQLNSTQLKLSVSSAGRLPNDLQSLKNSLGLILVNLEDATVDLGWCITKQTPSNFGQPFKTCVIAL